MEEQDRLSNEQHLQGYSREVLFSYTLGFVQELETICRDIEKSLLLSFPQRLAGWALQPWSPNKETALAKVTGTMRERLGRCLNRQFLNPINSNEVIVDLDPIESYILPSAHFPLLLTFQCQDLLLKNDSSSPFPPTMNNYTTTVGRDIFGQEQLYRTTIEVINIRSSLSTTSERNFVIRACVAGAVKESARR